ncbi:MAG: hypothetical protein OHK0039_21390 [Bacteroidia bacterium]
MFAKYLFIMHNSQLISLLRSLDTAAQRRFDRWVASPWVHQHADTQRLWAYLRPYGPDYTAAGLEAETAFAQLYPGQPYDDGQMRTLRKYLLRLLRDFLACETLQSDELLVAYGRVQALLTRDTGLHVSRQLRQADKLLGEAPVQNAEYFMRAYLIENLKLDHAIQHEPRHTLPGIRAVNAALDAFYLTEKLRYLCTERNLRAVIGATEEQILLAEPVLTHVAANYDTLPVIVRAYFEVYTALGDPSEEVLAAYHRLRALLPGSHLGREDLLNLYSGAINIANQQYRRGDEAFLREMFDLYREMLDRGLLDERGMLAMNNYKNIVTLGLRLKDFDWTEQFIETYRARLSSPDSEGVYHYNLAHLYSYQQRYGEALRHLQQVEFLDPFYQISYKMLQLKIFYECEEVEALLALTQTFRTFVRRQQQLPANRKAAHINFARFVRALFMVRIGQKHNLDAIEAAIHAADALIEKGWLLDKAAELRSA